MKKWIKIIGFSFMGLFIAALLFPLLFKNKAKEILKTEVSKVSGIKVDFKDLSISIISSFPDLGLKIDSLSLKDSMKEVLFDAKEVAFDFDLIKLIRSGFKSFELNKLSLDQPTVNILYSKSGASNLDGLTKTDSTAATRTQSPLTIKIEQTRIKNGTFRYRDSSAETYVYLTNLNHDGGVRYDLNDLTILQTSTFDSLNFLSGSTKYLADVQGKMDGTMVYHLDSNKLDLIENAILLNLLKADIEGSLTFNELNTELNLHLKTPKNDLTQLVSLIPGAYQHHFDQLTTQGSFLLDSKIAGQYNSNGRRPSVDLSMHIKDGQVKYSHLPYPIDHIALDYTFKTLDTTFTAYELKVPKYHFQVLDDAVEGHLEVRSNQKNIVINGKSEGRVDLHSLELALPIDSLKMTGHLNFDATYAFDNEHILKNKLDKVTLDGRLQGDKIFVHLLPYKPFRAGKITATLNPVKSIFQLDSVYYGRTDMRGSVEIKNPLALTTAQPSLSQYIVSIQSNLMDIDELSSGASGSTNNSRLSETDFAFQTNILFNAVIQKMLYKDYEIGHVTGSGKYLKDTLTLSSLSMLLNQSEITTQGQLNDPYRWSNDAGTLSGNIHLQSKLFEVDPWMSNDAGNGTISDSLFIKNLPPSTNLIVSAKLDQAKYDGWVLKGVNFAGVLKDQVLEIQEGKSSLFGGEINLSGVYSEHDLSPDFNLKLDLAKLRIEDMFKTSKVFAQIAPVAAFLEGLFSSSLIMQGGLNKDMEPIWSEFDAAGVLETVNGLFSKFKPLEEISKKIQLPILNFFKWEKSKNWFEIENGKITIKPFTIKQDDILLTISGSQQIDQLMDYNVVMSIPRKTFDKYKVGLSTNATLDWLRNQAASKGLNITALDTIFVSFNLQGTFSQPSYTLNLAENPAGKSLAQQIQEDITTSIKQKTDSIKDAAEAKMQSTKDSIIDLIKGEVSQRKEQLDSLTKVVEDSLKKMAEKQTKILLDSIIKKETTKVLDSAIQTQLDTLLSKKAKEEIEIINEKLKNWNPFKKKPTKENQQ